MRKSSNPAFKRDELKRAPQLYVSGFTYMHAEIKSKLIILVSLSLFISGCVYYPKKIDHYDTECKITFSTLELESKEMRDACAKTNSGDPSGAACLAGIATLGAASAIVSGTLVMVGNTAYWLGKEGRCLAKP